MSYTAAATLINTSFILMPLYECHISTPTLHQGPVRSSMSLLQNLGFTPGAVKPCRISADIFAAKSAQKVCRLDPISVEVWMGSLAGDCKPRPDQVGSGANNLSHGPGMESMIPAYGAHDGEPPDVVVS